MRGYRWDIEQYVGDGGLRSVAQQVVGGEINAEILSLSAYAGSLLNIEGTVNIDVRSKDMIRLRGDCGPKL